MTTGRVIEAHRTNYTVRVAGEEYIATVRGVFHAEGDYPKVGDYVTLELLADQKAVIEQVEPRQTVIKRRGAEDDEVQVIAANVDLIIIVMGLDGDYNLSRLERYLLLAKQSEIAPIVVLNKKDLVEDVEAVVAEVKVVAGEVPVYAVSARTGDGLAGVARPHNPTPPAVLRGGGCGRVFGSPTPRGLGLGGRPPPPYPLHHCSLAWFFGSREVDHHQLASSGRTAGGARNTRGRQPRPTHHHLTAAVHATWWRLSH